MLRKLADEILLRQNMPADVIASINPGAFASMRVEFNHASMRSLVGGLMPVASVREAELDPPKERKEEREEEEELSDVE